MAYKLYENFHHTKISRYTVRQLQRTWDNTILEAYLLPNYCNSVPLESFPIIALGKQLRRNSRDILGF